MSENKISVSVLNETQIANTDIERTLFELDKQIDLLSSHADKIDYFVAAASGVICGMMDILWVGEFDLGRGRGYANEEIEGFVKRTAKLLGCKDDGIKGAVAFLEEKFKIPADGNTPDFGGGLQHHLRDFAHHPTIVGLIFSLLTQFMGMSYGTDTSGMFIIVPVPEKSKTFIGESVPDKIFRGTVIWLFHLISDIAGSSSTAGLSGGTGIPGPILSMVKEISVLPFMKDVCVNEESLSLFISKLFNGTLFAKHDEAGKIIKGTEIKLDFRGELGALAEMGRQAIPVIANDCIVRTFYFIRRLAITLKENEIHSIKDFKDLDWKGIVPFNNPTISRMLLVATGVFTTIDVTEAIVTEKYFVSVNYVGIGRFTVALSAETINYLKLRDVKRIKDMYEKIQRNTYSKTDDNIYGRLNDTMNVEKFGLTVEQTEILYNIELQKTLNDIERTSVPIGGDGIKELKQAWVEEWKHYMEIGFAGFIQNENAELHWYDPEELKERISENEAEKVWYRLVLLEAMVFEPYYPLSLEKDKKGNDIPSKKYQSLHNPIGGYKKGVGDDFLDERYLFQYASDGYVARLRKTYNKVLKELNEVLKSAITGLAVTAAITVVAILTAGMFAPAIAVALVGSNFAGLSGAALTSACLAYLGGGAVAMGGLGMAGGTMAIVGGSAILGVGVGAGAGAAVTAAGIAGKESTILQSAKLMVSVREIFLNDEHDLEYSNYVYEQYVNNIAEIEKKTVDLKLKESVASKEEKKKLKLEIKNMEESAHAMKIAMKSMNRFKSAFEVGMGA